MEAPHNPALDRYVKNGDGTALNALNANDDREIVENFNGVAASFGLIQTTSGICSSVLVGKDLVLTNAHCVTRVVTKTNKRVAIPVAEISFYAHLSNGSSSASSSVIGLNIPKEFLDGDASFDYALLKLKDSIGEKFGFIEAVPVKNIYYNRNLVKIIGYDLIHPQSSSTSPVPFISGQYCRLTMTDGFTLKHNCPIGPGSSGGPMMMEIDGEYKLIGIQSAQTKNQDQCSGFNASFCYNLGISSNRFLNEIIQYNQSF